MTAAPSRSLSGRRTRRCTAPSARAETKSFKQSPNSPSRVAKRHFSAMNAAELPEAGEVLMSSRARAVCPPEKKSSRLGRKSPRLISHLLYDQVTDLPTLPLFLGRIRRELKRSKALGLITLNVIQNQWIEQIL